MFDLPKIQRIISLSAWLQGRMDRLSYWRIYVIFCRLIPHPFGRYKPCGIGYNFQFSIFYSISIGAWYWNTLPWQISNNLHKNTKLMSMEFIMSCYWEIRSSQHKRLCFNSPIGSNSDKFLSPWKRNNIKLNVDTGYHMGL